MVNTNTNPASVNATGFIHSLLICSKYWYSVLLLYRFFYQLALCIPLLTLGAGQYMLTIVDIYVLTNFILSRGAYLLTGKDRVIFVTEEDHNEPAAVSLPEDDEPPGMSLFPRYLY